MSTAAWEDLPTDIQALIDGVVAKGDPVVLTDEQERPWAMIKPISADEHAAQSNAPTTEQA